MNNKSENKPIEISSDDVSLVTPTNQAIYEAGKAMLIESISVGREFCKFMIGTSMSAIPIYLALLKFVLPEKYVPTWEVGIVALIPAVLFLLSGVVFLIGYFPQQGIASLDIPKEIEKERQTTVKRRQKLSVAGFGVFCAAILAGLLITGHMLQLPKEQSTEQSAPADAKTAARLSLG